MRKATMRNTVSSVLLAGILSAGAVEAGVRNYFAPQFEGTSVDACLTTGECGKPAADSFCKLQGYDKAMIFEREPSAMTRRIDSGQTCSATACTAFRQVKCFTTKTDLAALSS